MDGSIRVSSSLCGVVVLMPTYGLVIRHGVIPLSLSLDHVGFISNSARDIAAMLECTAGWDPLDLMTAEIKKEEYTKTIDKSDIK